MRKSEFIDQVARKAEMSRAVAARAVEAIFDTTSGALAEAIRATGQISLPGFGRFRARKRKARRGRNPQTGAMIDIPERTVIQFNAGRDLRETLGEETPIPTSSGRTRGSGASATKKTSGGATGAARKSSGAGGGGGTTRKSAGAAKATKKSTGGGATKKASGSTAKSASGGTTTGSGGGTTKKASGGTAAKKGTGTGARKKRS